MEDLSKNLKIAGLPVLFSKGGVLMKIADTALGVFFTGVIALFMSSAFAGNGIQFSEFDFYDGRFYVACLGEEVDVHQYVTSAYHEFDTPSGTYHLIDNWRITLMWTGVTTGRTWVGRNVSPYQLNIGPGMTEQFIYKGVQKPLGGDGPMFFYGTEFKVTVTANGEQVVERMPQEPFGDRVRCLGNR